MGKIFWSVDTPDGIHEIEGDIEDRSPAAVAALKDLCSVAERHGEWILLSKTPRRTPTAQDDSVAHSVAGHEKGASR